MAWTAPRTWATGDVSTAAMLNTHIRDDEAELRAGGIAIASQAALDFMYASSATQWARLAAGGKFTLPRINNGATAWEFKEPLWLRAFNNTQTVNDANANEKILYTYTIPANLLTTTGRTIRLTSYGSFNDSTDSRTVRVRLGGIAGTIIVSASYTTAGLNRWIATAYIARTGLNTQRLAGTIEIVGSSANDPDRANITTGAATESGTIDLVVTGQNAGAVASKVVHENTWIEQLGVPA